MSVQPVGARESAKESGASSGLPYAVALLTVVLTYWTVDIVSPALPEIKHDLRLTAAGAGLVFSLMFLGRLIGNFPATYLLVRSGAATTAVLGGGILTIGSIIAASANQESVMLPARFLQGIGISLLVNAGLRSILKAKPGRGAAMSYFAVATTIGGVFGLQSGGYLTGHLDWRAVFVLSALLAVVMTILALASFVGARRTTPQTANSQLQTASGEPAVSWRELLSPLAMNFVVFANYSIWIALPLYTTNEFDASPGTNANLLLVVTLVHLVAVLPVARSIRRFGAMDTLLLGLFAATTATLLILAAPSPIWMVLPLVLYGAGMMAAVNAGGDIVLQRGGLSGQAVGYVRLSSDLGLVVGPYFTGALADAFGFGAPFIVWPAVMALALVVGIWQRLQQWETR